MIYVFMLTTILLATGEIFAYRQGLKDGFKLYNKEPIKETEREIEEVKPSIDEIARINIENYSGSEVGQIEYEKI